MKLAKLHIPPGVRIVITLGDLPPIERHPDSAAHDIYDPVRIEVLDQGDYLGSMEIRRAAIDGDAPEQFIEMLLENHPRPGPRLVD